jgi:hypothetical protein
MRQVDLKKLHETLSNAPSKTVAPDTPLSVLVWQSQKQIRDLRAKSYSWGEIATLMRKSGVRLSEKTLRNYMASKALADAATLAKRLGLAAQEGQSPVQNVRPFGASSSQNSAPVGAPPALHSAQSLSTSVQNSPPASTTPVFKPLPQKQ